MGSTQKADIVDGIRTCQYAITPTGIQRSPHTIAGEPIDQRLSSRPEAKLGIYGEPMSDKTIY